MYAKKKSKRKTELEKHSFMAGIINTETKVQTEQTVGERGGHRLKYTKGQIRKQITGTHTQTHS